MATSPRDLDSRCPEPNKAKEWGTPLRWWEVANYTDTASWNDDRWQWEFLRRNADYRELYLDARRTSQASVEIDRYWTDDEQAALVKAGLQDWPFKHSTTWRWGLPMFFDPRVSDWTQFGPRWGSGFRIVEQGEIVDHGFHMSTLRFNLRRPLKPQIDEALDELQAAQRVLTLRTYGHLPSFDIDDLEAKNRMVAVAHPKRRDKWLCYLQALDARNVGASYSTIAESLLGGDMTNAAQRASELVKQARGARILI